jgi:uncharacterized LabA/DUF88 family protein
MDQSLDVTHLIILVDGQNLISHIRKLFKHEFDPEDYLPQQANWRRLFRSIGNNLGAQTVNVYWYTIKELDFHPHVDWSQENLDDLSDEQFEIWKKYLLRKNLVEIWNRKGKVSPVEKSYMQEKSLKNQKKVITRYRRMCFENEQEMQGRLKKWHDLQDNIVAQYPSTRIRRLGWQVCNSVDKRLHQEKGVDIGLATDLVLLEPYYDTALLFTSDGDFVPAIKIMQRRGKNIGHVEFAWPDGRVLGGTSRRLRETSDFTIEVPFTDFQTFMGIPLKIEPAQSKEIPT